MRRKYETEKTEWTKKCEEEKANKESALNALTQIKKELEQTKVYIFEIGFQNRKPFTLFNILSLGYLNICIFNHTIFIISKP